MGTSRRHDQNIIRVLLADDHDIVRHGLRSVIESAEDIEVIAEAENGFQALERYKQTFPDVSILEISMSGMNGTDVIRSILKVNPGARILVLTMHVSQDYLNEVLHAGAGGYLLKSVRCDELLESIRAMHRGEKVFSRAISRLMTDSYVNNVQADRIRNKPLRPNLTRRELEVLQLIAEGMTSQEISEALFISPRTVDTHRSNLIQKVGVRNTAGLVRHALEKGISGR